MECFESAVPAIFISYAPTFFPQKLKHLQIKKLRRFVNLFLEKLLFVQMKSVEVNLRRKTRCGKILIY